MAERLAELLVVERRGVLDQDDGVGRGGLRLVERDARGAAEVAPAPRVRHLADDVGGAGLEVGDARRRLDHRHPADLVHLGLAGHVELVPAADEQVRVRHALDEAEGPGPDRLEADLLDVLLGHDHREGEVGQERRRRLLEEEPHPVVVDAPRPAPGRG